MLAVWLALMVSSGLCQGEGQFEGAAMEFGTPLLCPWLPAEVITTRSLL